jgi:hypothetical protein
MKTKTLPRCPWCGSKQVYEDGERNFFCRTCKRVFDNDPNEGSDYSDRNPAARIEREEREADRKRLAVRQGVKRLFRK